MKDLALSTNNLKRQEKSLKASQSEEANKLMNYLSDKIGFKLTPVDAYFISLEMQGTDPVVKNLMSNLEKFTVEQKHISELIEEIGKHLNQKNSLTSRSAH